MPHRRRLSLSLSGSDFPIYLLDNSSFVLRLTPAITVGSAIIAIREQVGLDYDAHHALFELLADGELIQLEDDKHFVRIIGRWQQESVSEGACASERVACAAQPIVALAVDPAHEPRLPPFNSSLSAGPHRIYFKRALFVPGSLSADAEIAHGSGAHRLAFIDAVFHYLNGHLRVDTRSLTLMAAYYLYSLRGPAHRGRDRVDAVAAALQGITPPYATQDGVDSHPLASPALEAHASAPMSRDLSVAILDAWLSVNPHWTVFDAEAKFLEIARSSACYGALFFEGRVLDESGGAGIEALVCVGHAALTLVSHEDPLHALDVCEFADMGQTEVGRDVFGWTMTDGTHSFLRLGSAESAAELRAAVSRSLTEYNRISRADAASAPGRDSSAKPRAKHGVGTVPTILQYLAPPMPPWLKHMRRAAAKLREEARGGSSDLPDSHWDDLPPGWIAASDDDGDLFFYHTTTRARTWDHPGRPSGPLPPGWDEQIDSLDGSRFFVSRTNGEVTFVRPSVGAMAGAGADGGPEGEAVRVAPSKPLPVGWRVAYDPADGAPYYYEKSTGSVSWSFPGE